MEQVAPVGPVSARHFERQPSGYGSRYRQPYLHARTQCLQPAGKHDGHPDRRGPAPKAAAKAGVPVQVHRLGSMFTVFFTDQEVYDYDSACTSDLDAFRIYFHSMLEQGIYLPPSQFETNFLSLAPYA